MNNKEISPHIKKTLVGEYLPDIKLSKERRESLGNAINFWKKCGKKLVN